MIKLKDLIKKIKKIKEKIKLEMKILMNSNNRNLQ
jgi:hypothetical protein